MNPIGCSFEKIRSQKNISYEENKEKDLIIKVKYHSSKCGSSLQMFKHDVLENLGLQISGISRQHTPSMLVSIGAQHSHLQQVL